MYILEGEEKREKESINLLDGKPPQSEEKRGRKRESPLDGYFFPWRDCGAQGMDSRVHLQEKKKREKKKGKGKPSACRLKEGEKGKGKEGEGSACSAELLLKQKEGNTAETNQEPP